MTIFESLIFGLVEGLTEFLPISSTAHLDITRTLLNLPSTEFFKSFEIVIQFGAILSILFLYHKDIFKSFTYFKKTIIAFIPTGIIGFLLYSLIKNFLLGNIAVIAWALLSGGVLILLFEKFYNYSPKDPNKDIEDLTNKELLTMGTLQALAVVPGVSRSLSVILTGRSLGLSRALSAKFSFLLAVPTMFFASAYDLYRSGVSFAPGDWNLLLIGFAVSFITAFLSVKWFMNYVRHNSFAIFGWYRIIIALSLFFIFV